MYDQKSRHQALTLHSSGLTISQVSRATGISRAAIHAWTIRPTPHPSITAECPLRDGTLSSAVPRKDYSYLLGLYLGDGCVSHISKGVHTLRIACADAWPGLIDECARTLSAVMPANKVGKVQCKGCTSVQSYSKHWPCLFPQHGPGPKHARKITLSTWQQEIVHVEPWALLRGLIHSDGSRTKNWAQRTTDGVARRHDYIRYEFTNKSADIRQIYTDALDLLSIDWKISFRRGDIANISVARRASVALMDEHIGPKY